MAIKLKKVERPRELKWMQAGAMLYGDWGTSKAYVLGIAFALSGHASWFFLGIMSVLTALIGVCYMVICRMYPDGGGVYSALKDRFRLLAVVGALLLIADYVITASLSTLAAFHYFNVPDPEIWAVATILMIGAINWIGPVHGGNIATVIAVAASAVTGVLFLSTLPHLPHVELTLPHGSFPQNWGSFVGIVLALSGVEAVANMTGIMAQPVRKTAKRAILPVLLEVSMLTFLLGVAMNAVPGLTGHAEDMLRVLGSYYIGPWYWQIVGIVFGVLLLSATNTAVAGLVNIQFALAKDRELPSIFARLNRFGMPWLALIVAMVVPAFILLVEHNMIRLAAFYAIGVVGAITLNLGASALNFQVPIKKWERGLLFIGAIILLFIEVTIAFEKHNALLFALTVLGTGLGLRFLAKTMIPAPVPVELPEVNVLTVSEAKELAPLYRSSTFLALKTLNLNLLEEAALRIKALGENSLYLGFVEEAPASVDLSAEIEPSIESIELLAKAQQEMEQRGITAVPIWQFGREPGKLIANAAKELEVKTVMIGTTRRGALTRLFRGDVLRTLAKRLPKECHLAISG